MTSKKNRAFHFGGASWLLLCAMADGAMAQDAAAPAASTQLPEITVTAPSPIVRRKPVVPSRTPARVARAAPGQNRERAPEPQPAPVAAAPQPGVLPVVTDQFATVTVVPNEEIRRSGGATLGDLLFSKPGITGSSFAPGASSRPIIRGLDGNRVGIVENGTGGGGVSDLGEDHFVPIDPLATNQVEVVRGPAALRYGSTSIGGVVSATNNRIPEALPSCPAAPFQSYGLPVEGAAGGCAIRVMRDRRDAHRRQFGRSRRRRRHSARCRRRQFRRPRRRLWPQGRRLQHPRLSLSVRPDAARERKATELGRAGRRRFGRRLLHLPRRLHRRCDHAERRAVSHPRHRRRRSPDPDRGAPDQVFGQGRIPAGRGGDRCRQVLGQRHRLQAQRDRSRRSRRPRVVRRAADFYQQGAGRPRRGADDAVQRALCRRHHRLRPAGQPPATDGAEPGRSGQPAQRFVGPEQKHQGRRLRLQRVQVHRRHQGADCRPHRACQSQRNDAVVHSGAVRPQRQSRRYRAADRAQPEFHAEEREHRPDPESAGPTGCQHHRAICRARAKARGIVFARGARRHRHLRYRQSQPRHRNRQDDRDRIAEGDRTVQVRSDRLLHQIQRLHLPPPHRQHLRGCRLCRALPIRLLRSN